jgi:hypothetical protein
MPVFYATGSKWKGFWWSFLSGVSEPIGGLFGYLILYGNNESDIAYAILFGELFLYPDPISGHVAMQEGCLPAMRRVTCLQYLLLLFSGYMFPCSNGVPYGFQWSSLWFPVEFPMVSNGPLCTPLPGRLRIC